MITQGVHSPLFFEQNSHHVALQHYAHKERMTHSKPEERNTNKKTKEKDELRIWKPNLED